MIITELVREGGADTCTQELHNGVIEIVTVITYECHGVAWTKTKSVTYDGYHTLSQALFHRGHIEEAHACFQACYDEYGREVVNGHNIINKCGVEMLQWLLDNQKRLGLDSGFWNILIENVFGIITHSYVVQVLQWLLDNQEKLGLDGNYYRRVVGWDGSTLAMMSVIVGNVQVLQWLFDHQEMLGAAGNIWREVNSTDFTIAHHASRVESSVLQWLLDNRRKLGLDADFWNMQDILGGTVISNIVKHIPPANLPVKLILANEEVFAIPDALFHSHSEKMVKAAIELMEEQPYLIGMLSKFLHLSNMLQEPLIEVSNQARSIYRMVGASSSLRKELLFIVVALIYGENIKARLELELQGHNESIESLYDVAASSEGHDGVNANHRAVGSAEDHEVHDPYLRDLYSSNNLEEEFAYLQAYTVYNKGDEKAFIEHVIEILQCLLDSSENTPHDAYFWGHIKWLCYKLAYTVASSGEPRVLQWLLDNQERCELSHAFWHTDKFNVVDAAVAGDNVPVLKWILGNRYKLGLLDYSVTEICSAIVDIAFNSYDVETIQWLVDNEDRLGLFSKLSIIKVDHTTFISGDAKVREWVLYNEDKIDLPDKFLIRIDSTTLDTLVTSGNVEVLNWLLYNKERIELPYNSCSQVSDEEYNFVHITAVELGVACDGRENEDGEDLSVYYASEGGVRAEQMSSSFRYDTSMHQCSNITLEIRPQGKINQNKGEKIDKDDVTIIRQKETNDNAAALLIRKLVADMIDNLPDTYQAREYISNYEKILTKVIDSPEEKMRKTIEALFSVEDLESKSQEEKFSFEEYATIKYDNTTDCVDVSGYITTTFCGVVHYGVTHDLPSFAM